jgi:hypothetical protein
MRLWVDTMYAKYKCVGVTPDDPHPSYMYQKLNSLHGKNEGTKIRRHLLADKVCAARQVGGYENGIEYLIYNYQGPHWYTDMNKWRTY